MGVRYVWSDPATGNIVKSGDATASDGGFVVPFSAGETAALIPGLYRLSITAYSDELSTVSERVLTVEASATGTTTGTENGTTTTPTDDEDDESGGCGFGAPSADMLLICGAFAGVGGG